LRQLAIGPLAFDHDAHLPTLLHKVTVLDFVSIDI
jgi:hypothetical protein